MAPSRPSGRRRRRDERGSTLVEAAFVMPIFLLLVFGVIEFAGVVMTQSGTSNGAQAGARMATVKGKEALADREILLRIDKETAGLPSGEIQQIVIWHATGPGESPPAACIAQGSSGITNADPDAIGNCNVYNDPEAPGGAFDRAKDPQYQHYFGCPTTPDDGYNSQRLDCMWPAASRKDQQGLPGTAAQGKVPDYVGIYIRSKHDYYTGFFGKSVTIGKVSIGRIEPQEFTNQP